MQTLIPNRWESSGDLVRVARILRHDQHPEGLDFVRVRFDGESEYQLPSDHGALLSVLVGKLRLSTAEHPALELGPGTHVYLPPGSRAQLFGTAGTELLHACSPTEARARGRRLLVRSDRFLAGCALPGRSLRWILTPQYLSRRAFLHHDQTLLSKEGEPLSWFHTTMFDAHGLPPNDEGDPVFKMSYNFRTEPNVCYEVVGNARVRVAKHPYGASQAWGPWESLSGETTYHLYESAGEAEWVTENGQKRPRRNKHEVSIEDGYVSLICMHSPGCTGAERHSEGEYSEYGDLSLVLGTRDHEQHLERLKPYDSMVDALSLALAEGRVPEQLPEWERFEHGLACQREVEMALLETLRLGGQGREQILKAWVLDSGRGG